MTSDIRIGIDVGGTNTDAVAVRGGDVVAAVKRPTTAVTADGIVDALNALLSGASFDAGDVSAVMVGTTQFVNAVVQSAGLARTGVLRIGLPATAAVPPLVDWPGPLRAAVGEHVFLCAGGHEYDGSQIAPLDRGRLAQIADTMAVAGVAAVAITSVFSPINADFEVEAASIIAASLPGVPVTLSSELGRIGLLERENATVMNACLRVLASDTIAAFRDALSAASIGGQLFVSQNDGTLMSADFAARFPVATFASGPTNSMRGAAFLSGLRDAAVVDVGGTTSDVGVLVRGFPRPAALAAEVGGVRTNFRMPDVLSLGIGGGSIVRHDGQSLSVGPDSVGYLLRQEALVFGGQVTTATDLAVAAGHAAIGEPRLVDRLDRSLVRAGLRHIEHEIAAAVDRMKISADPVPVVVVGGGGALLGQDLPGAAHVVRPDNGAVANAIGAALAQAGGEADRIVNADRGRKHAVEAVVDEAVSRAIDAGAIPDTVNIVEIDEVPISYLPGNALRVRAKAVGDLRVGVLA
jgi:N-methylhydantoinase A/oxoprolinase/acetone carboxylase beta subunit